MPTIREKSGTKGSRDPLSPRRLFDRGISLFRRRTECRYCQGTSRPLDAADAAAGAFAGDPRQDRGPIGATSGPHDKRLLTATGRVSKRYGVWTYLVSQTLLSWNHIRECLRASGRAARLA